MKTRTFIWFFGVIALGSVSVLSAGHPRSVRGGDSDRPIQHVILVTVDGMRPAFYTHPEAEGVQVPTLERMREEGAWSPGALSVFPTQTYPAHTAIVTGTYPDTNGIVTNLAWDPLDENLKGWRWYAEDIRAPTLWQVAEAHGLRAAMISWPVTVGARAAAVVPEFWRAHTPDDLKLLRALWFPRELFAAVSGEFPDFSEGYAATGTTDAALTDIAVHLIEAERPNLLMLHIFQVDHAEHSTGVHTEATREAVENADRQIGRLIEAARREGIWDHTVLVVASDHGMADYSRTVRPGLLLAGHGLVTLNAHGRVSSWRAVVVTDGGSSYLYARRPHDLTTEERLGNIFRPFAGQPSSGIAAVLDRQQIAALHGDPKACLALIASPGAAFVPGYTSMASAPPQRATHGYLPTDPDMKASLLVYGPGIGQAELADARLIDIAPTIAGWLGFRMDKAQGRALPIPLKGPAERNGH